jgi:mycotoxin biosynthesis protein UstYa
VIVPGDEKKSLVMLGMWHQLHCLNIVRKALYRERWPEMWKLHENGSVNFDTEEMYHIGKFSMGKLKI